MLPFNSWKRTSDRLAITWLLGEEMSYGRTSRSGKNSMERSGPTKYLSSLQSVSAELISGAMTILKFWWFLIISASPRFIAEPSSCP